MSEELLCLGCFDDIAEPNTAPAYCLACGMKHEDAIRASSKSYAAKTGRIGWDGLTRDYVDPDDLDFGYFIMEV